MREVVALPPFSRFPGVAGRVLGLANVHGILVTVLRAPTLSETPEPAAPELLVVLTLHQGQVGFAVEEVEELAAPEARGARTVDVEAVVRGVLGGP